MTENQNNLFSKSLLVGKQIITYRKIPYYYENANALAKYKLVYIMRV